LTVFFIGNAIGSQGLAGVTLAYPAYMVIIANGSNYRESVRSSLTALKLGKGNFRGALDIMHNAFFPLSSLQEQFFTVAGLVFL